MYKPENFDRATMATIDKVRDVLGETLGLGDRTASMLASTPLLGNLPELDSMAVVEIVTRLEADFQIRIHDDEISAETFATLGSLTGFIEGKL
ncbi:acyl carrier protein [Iodidimonas sp. SYSU 1G8]|uniref:acyl carrier protein n=1 Tax=Iodidimonas sp. SYSU 1G8 TaxID=3133967 RepID=UPI0031FEECBF